MSEMIERVAREIRIANAGEYTSVAASEILARAAMEAMLEPTESMNFAGSIIGDYPWDGKKPSRVFSAMILAALEVK